MTSELDERPDSDLEPPDPRVTAIAGGCLYTLLLAASLVWLSVRDRLWVLPSVAVGEHGAPVAAGTGLAVGLAGYAVYVIGLRRLPSFEALAAQIRQMLGSLSDTPVLALVLFGAVAEEVFFRLAVQDQFGLAGSVATYSIVATGALGLRWLALAALHATVLGGLMSLGFGLLATTIANAVMNYLALRRMLTS